MLRSKEKLRSKGVTTIRICLIPLMIAATVLASCMMMTSCGEKEISETIKVAAMNGPTGMGMVELFDNDKIEISTFQAADEAAQKLISGEVDIAALPSNMAAVLYNKTNGNVVALSTVCSGVLYLMENGSSINKLSDLKGKTIIASGKGGTPEYVLTVLLEKAGLKPGEDVQIQWMDVHADVAQALLANPGTVAMLPEPFVSTVKAKSEAVNIAVDMNEEWKKNFDQSLPMGVLLTSKKFAEERPDDVKAFLEQYKKSAEAVCEASDEIAEKIVKAGFLGDASITKAAIPRCNIECQSPADNKKTLKTFFETLYKLEPKAVGGSIPDDGLYYAG